MAAFSDPRTDKPQAFNPPNVPTPPPTYNQVSITPLIPSSKLVTLAGQVGVDPSTHKVAEGFEAQVRLAYRNVLNTLKAAGATPRDIVHVRHYIVKDTKHVGVESEEELTEVWGRLWMEFMDKEGEGHRPPDTVLGVACLATKYLLYECEVWAIVQGGRA
ncbi:YjgF-like protein [Byssothecium circinans]|uniref:YjgF-like protein n=1 Tax=Byssothecium circinans TaxID=147558 RepID=A0A6A5TRQ7_9PLEO|nr:YjgF-like protein [Byssothecium circinans]